MITLNDAPVQPEWLQRYAERNAIEYYAATRDASRRWHVRIMRTTTADPYGHHLAQVRPDIDEEIADLGTFRPMSPQYLHTVLNNRHGARAMKRLDGRGRWLVVP